MINLLTSSKGEFHFLDKELNTVKFSDYRDIPRDFEFSHVTKFLPEIPPPPHTLQQHEEIHAWSELFNELMEKERASSN